MTLCRLLTEALRAHPQRPRIGVARSDCSQFSISTKVIYQPLTGVFEISSRARLQVLSVWEVLANESVECRGSAPRDQANFGEPICNRLFQLRQPHIDFVAWWMSCDERCNERFDFHLERRGTPA